VLHLHVQLHASAAVFSQPTALFATQPIKDISAITPAYVYLDIHLLPPDSAPKSAVTVK